MTWAQAFHDVGIGVAIAAVFVAAFWASTRS